MLVMYFSCLRKAVNYLVLMVKLDLGQSGMKAQDNI